MADKEQAPRKEYELLKPLRVGSKPIEPAVAGKPPVKIKLRDDQAARLSGSGHIKMVA